LEDKSYPERVIIGILASLIRAGEENPASETPEPLVDRFRGFQTEWERSVKAFLADPAALTQEAEKLTASAAESEKSPQRSVINTVRFGGLLAKVRLPFEPTGPVGGRVPHLDWIPIEKDSPDLEAGISDLLNQLPDGTPAALEVARLPFYTSDAKLWHLWLQHDGGSGSEESDAFVITYGQDQERKIQVLDWTNAPIYELGSRLFRFSWNSEVYVRFFFHLVRGQLGRFIMIEDEDDIAFRVPWLHSERDRTRRNGRRATGSAGDGNSEEKIKLVAQYARPLQRRAMNADGEKRFRATIVFKNALFESEVTVNASSEIRLENETLIEEGLPVFVESSGDSNQRV
jgi:hypothetical protein